MPRFVVDAASLDRLGHRLGVLHTQLLSAPEVVGGFDAAMLGGRDLQAELDGFTRQWRHEMTTVADELDLLRMRLAEAGSAYRRIEHRHRASARAASATGSGITVIDPGSSHPGSARRAGTAGSGTTVIDAGSGHRAPSSGGHGSGTGSGTTVIGGGSGSGAGGSGTTVIGGTRQPVDAAPAASGFSSPLLTGQAGPAAGH
ncbi:MAG TPA: hypothetical protein VFN55_16800 [Solirubrobacteraceae bacterium]|nr:hypothetical protein [Solirubrobacteraceae bacterium]